MDFDLTFVWRNLPIFVDGLIVTIELSTAAVFLALVWGLVVAFGRLSLRKALRWPASAFIEVMRNTPVLVQMYVVFFGSAVLGFPLSGFASGLLALTLQNGAYFAEIYRAGVDSVGHRQAEAGKALGMYGWKLFFIVILPQALRRVLPPIGNQGVAIIKDTALVSTFSVAELTFEARVLTDRTAAATETFATLAAFYLVLTASFAGAIRLMEARTRLAA